MNRVQRVSVTALAIAAFSIQPLAANAGSWICPVKIPLVSPTTGSEVGPLPILWAAGFFLCAGFVLGKQDEDARKAGTTVSHKDRAHGFLSCVLPLHGLAKVYHSKS